MGVGNGILKLQNVSRQVGVINTQNVKLGRMNDFK